MAPLAFYGIFGIWLLYAVEYMQNIKGGPAADPGLFRPLCVGAASYLAR